MAEAVIDDLEVVKVDEQDGRTLIRLARHASQRVRHAIPKERAVGETGERIVKGLVLELILQPLPIGDVAEVQHHAPDRRLVQQILPNRLNPSP